MSSSVESSFVRCALKSELLTASEIQAAEAQLRAALPVGAGDNPINDRQLADKLVELGKLTKYQATQLLNNVSKFMLGSYRILDSIGQGGMGHVFKAEHIVMGRIVAVKVLPRHKSTPEAIANFMREIRVQAKFDHEHLVRAFDAGHDGNVYFLVTEYVPGMDLRRYVKRRGALKMSEAATIISQAALGLQHAHEQGLVHRDAKPGNILVTTDGHAKVSDLGLAGFLEADGGPGHPGKTVGTADYLPPEQIVSPGVVTPAGDIYSLGCTLYFAVTGKVPYPGGTVREKIHRHCKDMPLHPRHFNRALTDDFIGLIAEMMEKDPTKRIQTAAEVIERLAPWAREVAPAPGDASQVGLDDAPAPPLVDEEPVVSDEPLEDTADSFAEFVDIEQPDEQFSQASLGTDPVVAADLDTIPNELPRRLLAVRRRILDTPFAIWLLIVLVPVALVALGFLLAEIVGSM